MERRNHQEMGSSNPMVYAHAPPQSMLQESPPPPLKLPLAPETHRRPTAVLPTRRGSSIFSPAHHHQTLDRRPYDPPPPPPPQRRPPSPDPDPSTPTDDPPSKSKTPSPPRPRPPPAARYRECLKNHAANMGAHVVDGCGEFMPGGEDGTPDSLRCAACDCHRNFHRKENEGDPNNPHPHRSRNLHGHRFASPSGMVSFGGAEESSSGHAASKKRFRTKFGQDQKDRMREFADRVGWRIQKEDEEEVERFCGEVGVKRQVFKVWMHNNKQAMKKRSD